MMTFNDRFSSPVRIASFEAFRFEDRYLVRVTSEEGAIGVATVNNRLAFLYPIVEHFVVPFLLGRDARDLPQLVDDIYAFRSFYKLAGIALWAPVAYAELAILDMLGRMAGCSVGDLLGTVVRREIPIYLSSSRRDTTAAEEVDWLSERLAETGATAVKLKIGGRMSHNADAFPGRTERLIPLARQVFGDAVTIYVDANSTYDAEGAIEIGALLADYDVAFLEEPCPWQDYWATKQVADTLTLPVAGGEQDTSLVQFDWMIRERVVDVVQPDMMYNGGLIRALRVATMAANTGMSIMPHSPKWGAEAAAVVQFGSIVENLGPYQEWQGRKVVPASWHAPNFEIHNGAVRVPDAPGLGITYDADIWNQAERIV